MSKNEDRFFVGILYDVINVFYPVAHICACGPVDEGVTFVEHQIAYMYYIPILKMIHHISIGMPGTIVIAPDIFITYFQLPVAFESNIGIQLLIDRVIFFSHCFLVS